MKRQDAFRKLRTVCRRLDEADPKQFFVIPLCLYLIGSLLTDKPNPSDIDLLFEYEERPDLDPDDMLRRLSYGKPLPHHQAITHLRWRMKWVRIELLVGSLEDWLRDHLFPPHTPVKVVWAPGLDWQQVVNEIESHPTHWDSALEQHHKFLQETAKQIAQDQGVEAVREWWGEGERGR